MTLFRLSILSIEHWNFHSVLTLSFPGFYLPIKSFFPLVYVPYIMYIISSNMVIVLPAVTVSMYQHICFFWHRDPFAFTSRCTVSVVQVYFITLYFKTSLIIMPSKLVSKCNFVYYLTFILRPRCINVRPLLRVKQICFILHLHLIYPVNPYQLHTCVFVYSCVLLTWLPSMRTRGMLFDALFIRHYNSFTPFCIYTCFASN